MNDIVADYGKRWRFTLKDLNAARYRHRYERAWLSVTNPLDEPELLRIFIYAMLSAAQNTTTLVYVVKKLMRYGLTSLQSINDPENVDRIVKILKCTRYCNEKTLRFMGLRDWWASNSTNLIQQIIEKSNSAEDMFNIRNELAEHGPDGVGFKVASFIIQLSQSNVKTIRTVIIDKWVLQLLKDCGYDVPVPDYKKVSGFWKKQYLDNETVLQGMAKEHDVSPAELGLLVWCKASYTEPNKSLEDYLKVS